MSENLHFKILVGEEMPNYRNGEYKFNSKKGRSSKMPMKNGGLEDISAIESHL